MALFPEYWRLGVLGWELENICSLVLSGRTDVILLVILLTVVC